MNKQASNKAFQSLTPQVNKESTKRLKGMMKKGGVKKTADVNIPSLTQPSSIGQGIGTNAFYTRPLDYNPELASPDRYLFPKDIRVINRFWRLFYRFDPIAGSVVDLYCEMPLSDYNVVGAGVEGEIKNDLMGMLNKINLIKLLNSIMVEFLVLGEAIPHLNYDANAGEWGSWSMHKPEEIEVIDTHLTGNIPYLILSPDQEDVMHLKKLHQIAGKLGEELPSSAFLEDLVKFKKVVLEPMCVSYLPRLLFPYDIRGTSVFTRMWRTFMMEDAVFNASLQTAKRHSSPVKTVTMGNLESNYIPSSDQVRDLLSSLAQAEADPMAWVFVPPGTKFDAWGVVDRIMSIKNEYDTIERLKLTALGVNKDFISGQTTFASAQAGIQVLMSRLLSFRTFMEHSFLYPKVFEPIARIRKWKIPTAAEVSHRVKTDRGEYIKPQIMWDKSLKARFDKDLLDAYKMIVTDFEIKLSERTITDAVGLNWQDEYRKNIEEQSIKKIVDKINGEQHTQENDMGNMGGGSMPTFESTPPPPETQNLEEIAPEPEMAETPEQVRMHASSLKNTKSDNFLSGSYKQTSMDLSKLDDKSVERKMSSGHYPMEESLRKAESKKKK